MYATNMHQFGHLVNPDGFNTTLTRPEMYEIFNNFDVSILIWTRAGEIFLLLNSFKDWSARYIRPEYYKTLESNDKLEQVII